MKVYEIKENGFLGRAKDIDPKEGVGVGWTYTIPEASGPQKWVNGKWESGHTEPEAFTYAADFSLIAMEIREKRNKLLSDCDWTQVADAPVDKNAWSQYRQNLRNITQQEGFPIEVIWPEKPQ